MERYINADLVLEKIQKELDGLMGIYNRHKSDLSDKMLTRLDGVIHGLESVRYRIKNAPTADVREIVLCKDCRWGREVCGNIECFADINIPLEYHGYEWFCPNGERRSEVSDGKVYK